MVQIVDEGPSKISRFIERATPGLDQTLSRLLQRKEDTALDNLGIDIKGIRDPQMRKLLVSGEQALQKQAGEKQQDLQTQKILSEYFGPEFAEVYGTLTEGGKTRFFEEVMETHRRGGDVRKLVQKYEAAGGLPVGEENLPRRGRSEEGQADVDIQEKISPQGDQIGIEEEEIGEAPIQFPTKGLLPKEQIQIQTKQAQDAMKREAERAAPFLKKMSEIRQNSHLKKNALTQMRNAIERGGTMTKDVIADRFNLPWLRSDEGAQLKLSTKEFLLGNIGRVGARPNQWIEQQIAQMAPHVGQRPSANLKMVAGLDFEADVEEKIAQVADELEQQYLKKWGYVPGNIEAQVYDKVRPYVEARQQELAYQLQQITEDYQSPAKFEEIKEVVSGTPLTLRKASYLKQKIREQRPDDSESEINKKTAQLARKLGYEIPPSHVTTRKRR